MASRTFVVIVDGQRRMASLLDMGTHVAMLSKMNHFLGLTTPTGGIAQSCEADFELDRNNMALALAASLALLNCKNISTRAVAAATRQLRRAAERANALPPYSYHVLDLLMKSHGVTLGDGTEPLALHWTRGHFKDYREGGGLFGKLRGLYWWGPHLAGRADRIVTKDYRLAEGRS
jgi:hypothetical protein